MKKSVVLAFVLSGIVVSACAQEIIRQNDPWLGSRQIAAARNTWKSLKIEATRKPMASDYDYADDLDFFALEYGKPFAPISFTVPVTGEWKTVHTDIRLGRGWGKLNLGRFALVMELEQDRPTDWRFLRWGDGGRDQQTFPATGDVVTVRHECGMIKGLERLQNLEIACLTTGANVRIRSLKLVPVRLPISWRRRFTLDDLPWKAGYTTMNRNVTVNGRPVWTNTMGGGIFRKDITSFLKVGENEIVVTANYNAGYGLPPYVLSFTEAFYVTKDGKTVALGTDENWEWRFGDGAWQPVRAWRRNGVERLPNGVEVGERGGYDPLHAGPLTVSPKTKDGFPLFDEGEPIEWNVAFPPEMKGMSVEEEVLGVRDPVKPLPTGAYRVRWTLRCGETVVDADEQEMLVVGRIAQDEISYADFEGEMGKRLELLQEIDCTQSESNPTNFMDHAGSNRAGEDLGGVANVGGFRARITGSQFGDVFSYAIRVGSLGEAHIAEVEFPDVDERMAGCSVQCTFPNDFCYNNLPGGTRAWPNATGSFRTGGFMPNSGKLETMRMVFFPGSSNVTFTVENAKNGVPAAVTKIRIYRVKGGLPALKIPETDRIYANHCERPLSFEWGAHVNPSANFYAARGPYVDGWRTAYEAAANRIRALRYAGHNAAIEGVFMYHEFFPTESGDTSNPNLAYDFFWVLARMYAKNGIKVLPCFEYMRAPRLGWAKGYDVSDREIKAGTKRGIYNVDWSGRQRHSYMNAGINYLAPEVWESITNLTREIYQRYSSLPNVAGFFTVNGYWWLPGFTLAPGINLEDVGFDDDSVELFTRETGIDLDGGLAGEARFARRRDLAFGRYRSEWNAWRARKLRSSLEIMASLLKGGAHDWRLFATPHITYPPINAFNRLDATKAERDVYQAARMLEAGFDVSLYGAGVDTEIQLVPEVNYQNQHDMSRYGAILSEGSKRLYAKNNAVYFSAIGLDEHFGMTAKGRKEWWWRVGGVTVYDMKPSGRNAFYDFVDVLATTSPKYMFHTWLDVNLTTGHAEESRRFLTGFFATPTDTLYPTPLVKGVTAKVADGALQLVNATPFRVTGRLEPKGEISDAITCRSYAPSLFSTGFDYALEPWGVTCFRGPRAAETTGSFRFDEADAKTVRDDGALVLGRSDLAATIDRPTWKRLAAARAAGDDYAMARLLRDVEILAPLLRYKASSAANANQRRLATALARDGVVRIDCGSRKDTVDEQGRLWLADQVYTGFGAYGSVNGRFVDRGAVKIARTPIESVYRTECGASGGLSYVIPVPDGMYEVALHFAETWDKLPGRKMAVEICGVRRPIDVWGNAGGRMAATQEIWNGVYPVNGTIRISFSGNSIVNGIEIRRCKDKWLEVK